MIIIFYIFVVCILTPFLLVHKVSCAFTPSVTYQDMKFLVLTTFEITLRVKCKVNFAISRQN